MARITVEDCLEQVENRFHLVRVASKRARQLMNGKEPTLDWDNDKATVVASLSAPYIVYVVESADVSATLIDAPPIV